MRGAQRHPAATDGGFTLVELLIVIIILGILAAVVALALPFVTGSATENVCRAEYRSVESAMAAYETVNGVLPTDIDDLRPFTDGELGQRWELQVTGVAPSTVVTVVGLGDCA